MSEYLENIYKYFIFFFEKNIKKFNKHSKKQNKKNLKYFFVFFVEKNMNNFNVIVQKDEFDEVFTYE